MKSFRILLCFLLATLVMTTCAWGGGWRILSEENPPFNGTRDGKPYGFAMDVVQEMLHRLKRSEPIEVMPWARAYHLLESRPDVFLFCTMRTKLREKQFHWIGPLQTVEWGLYSRTDNPKVVGSLDEAKTVGSIGATRSTAEEQYLLSLGFSNIESTNSFEANPRKLLAGRIDLWLHFDPGLPELLAENGIAPDGIRKELSIGRRDLYIAASKETAPETVRLWRGVFQDMVEDGTYERIRSKWFGALPFIPMRLVTEDAPPSSYVSNGQICGYSVAVVREILRRLQVTAGIEMMSWSRGYYLIQNSGTPMALFAMSRIPLREKMFKWVGPLYSQQWGFYARQDSPLELSTLEQALDVPRIGTYSDDAKDLYLRSMGFANLVQSQNSITAIRRLMAGQLDLWVSSDFKVPYFLSQAGVGRNVLKLVMNFKDVDDFIGFSSATPDSTIRQWQGVLDEMRRDGTLDFLLHRYRSGASAGH